MPRFVAERHATGRQRSAKATSAGKVGPGSKSSLNERVALEGPESGRAPVQANEQLPQSITCTARFRHPLASSQLDGPTAGFTNKLIADSQLFAKCQPRRLGQSAIGELAELLEGQNFTVRRLERNR